jgi:hypothetical protein
MGKLQKLQQLPKPVRKKMKQVHAQLRQVQALQLLRRPYHVMEQKVFRKMVWLQLV